MTEPTDDPNYEALASAELDAAARASSGGDRKDHLDRAAVYATLDERRKAAGTAIADADGKRTPR